MSTGHVKRLGMNILNSIFVAVLIFGTTTIDFAIGLRTPTLEFRHQNYQSSRNNNNNNKRSLYQNNIYDGLGSSSSSSSSFPKLRPLCTLSMARSTKEETSSSSEKKSDGNFFLDFVGGKRQETTDMDVARYLVSSEEVEVEKIIAADDIGNKLPLSTIFGTLAFGAALLLSQNPSVQHFFSDPQTVLQDVVNRVESTGDMGAVYFFFIYLVAEVLAIPAIPLTASAGYLFGVTEGTLVVLLAGSLAAAIGFLIGRTFLRAKVEEILEDYPKFKSIDQAIGKEGLGLKLMILLRIAPIFPFSLSNYLYGATSVEFWPYFIGTMIGFTPGTFAYVYTGTVGKALTLDSANSEPWYVYALGLAILSGLLKIAADVATNIIDSIEDDETD